MYRYLRSPWLCNLDWSSKKFRGKAKKGDMKKLLEQLETYYQQKEAEFRAGVSILEEEEEKEEGDGEGEGLEVRRGKEEMESRRTEFFISCDGPAKRAVHMPGYPMYMK